jgi:hypothetical protein
LFSFKQKPRKQERVILLQRQKKKKGKLLLCKPKRCIRGVDEKHPIIPDTETRKK